ncbi:MAG: ATP-binding protein, partial [Thermotoga sp.]
YDQNKECDLLIREEEFFGIETKYGKVKRKKYPFNTIYLSKEEIEDGDVIPLSLYLAGIEKSSQSI